MLEELRRPAGKSPSGRAHERTQQVTRWLVRFAMLGAIGMLAVVQGYETAALLRLLLLVALAAALPTVLRLLARALPAALAPWQRRTILVLVAALILAAFYFTARPMLAS